MPETYLSGDPQTSSDAVRQVLFKTSWAIKTLQASFKDLVTGEDERSASWALFVLFNRISNSLLRRLANIAKEVVDFRDAEGAMRQVQTISYLIDELARTFRVVQSARQTENLDFIIKPLEVIVKKVRYDTRILVTPVAEYNYKYEELIGPIVSSSENIEGISGPGLLHDDVCSKIVKLGFPTAESGNVLSYAGLAHEISHFIFEVENLRDICRPRYSDEQYREIELARLDTEEVSDVVYSWIKETICDCLAFYIMGPAFLFTVFQYLTLRGDVYRPKSSGKKHYPPPVLRFRNILACLDKLNPFDWSKFEAGEGVESTEQLEAIRNASASYVSKIDAVSKLEKLSLDRKHELARELTNSTLKELHSNGFFEKQTAHIKFPLDSFRRQVRSLYAKLAQKIPINEVTWPDGSPPRREVPDFRVILNVGWLYNLVSHDQGFAYGVLEDERAYGSFCDLNKVLRKSLELSEFDDMYRARRP